ncbi:MAG: formylglycine-generating enzyme family protein [Planctomycetes bacterium]|nr:formylglycine-generating enzyme family protein [Planctomycetota bacterium]
MRTAAYGTVLVLASATARGAAAEPFLRGDTNRSAQLDIADPIKLFGVLFLGDGGLYCPDAADADDTGSLDITDGIYALSFLFTGGRAPPAPFPAPGEDPTGDALGCEDGPACETFVTSLGMRLVRVPPGSFLMGSPESERGRWYVEGPVHRVRITRGFYLGATEVTQGQFERVMGFNPSHFQGPEHGDDLERPVERVSWDDAAEFCRRLSELEGRTYRLPTEAEWEYACRAGTSTRFSFGDALGCDDECAPCPEAEERLWWCGDGEPAGTKHAGLTRPNAWCLQDMHGSVWEWCLDWTERYSPGEATDPAGPPTGEEKVIRGGYFGIALRNCRSAMRGDLSTEHRLELLGFRVALEE